MTFLKITLCHLTVVYFQTERERPWQETKLKKTPSMTSVTHDDQDSCVIEDLEAPMDENNELSASPTLTQGVTAMSEEGDTHIVDLSDLGGAIVFKEDVKNQSAGKPLEHLGQALFLSNI